MGQRATASVKHRSGPIERLLLLGSTGRCRPSAALRRATLSGGSAAVAVCCGRAPNSRFQPLSGHPGATAFRARWAGFRVGLTLPVPDAPGRAPLYFLNKKIDRFDIPVDTAWLRQVRAGTRSQLDLYCHRLRHDHGLAVPRGAQVVARRYGRRGRQWGASSTFY